LYVQWICTFRDKSLEQKSLHGKFNFLNDSLLDVSSKLLNSLRPKFGITILRFLASYCSCIKPGLLTRGDIQGIMTSIPEASKTFDSKMLHFSWKFATVCFIYFPYYERPNANDWRERGKSFSAFIQSKVELVFLADKASAIISKEQLEQLAIVFRILKTVFMTVKDAAMQSRELIFQATEVLLPALMNMLYHFQNNLCIRLFNQIFYHSYWKLSQYTPWYLKNNYPKVNLAQLYHKHCIYVSNMSCKLPPISISKNLKKSAFNILIF
jgi:hypothetical protein